MLNRLITELGDRSLYDAVSQCSRCGYCEQACPTYVASGSEVFSARGRNQIVRMLVEGKIRDTKSAEEALSTCLLCGACSTACPAGVPTADIVLEGRRMLRGEPAGMAAILIGLVSRRPETFAALLRWAYRFQRWGLVSLVVKSRVLSLLGLKVLETAATHMVGPPKRFLFEELRDDTRRSLPEAAAWAYFAPCGPNYVLPHVGLATVKVLKAKFGPGIYLENRCCGLLSYNYGSLDEARSLARANITHWEERGCPRNAPIVGDCSSCVAFLKSYPQLFLEDAPWRERAQNFVERVRDVVEIFKDVDAEAKEGEGIMTYHDSCRALNGSGICAEPREALRRAGGAAYRELPEADVCCGGAGAFAFVHPEMSEDLLRKKTANIASTHARRVVTSSTSCLIQLARGLKKYYPECEVVHLSELLAEKISPGSDSQNLDG